ncbi:mechanosensitive ion channel family protein [Formosa sp. A9]|uniref:mechanosensitive ion channel family protein n=1 Tax=Formosa sp. A9 TaxID=3442641 RepID=UPI003EB882C6
MHFKNFIIALCFCMVMAGMSFNLHAQQTTTETSETDSLAVKPKAIPLINIIQEVEQTNSSLKLIQRKIKRPSNIAKIDSLLPLYANFLNDEGILIDNFTKANPNIQKINNVSVKWNGYLNFLNQWMDDINDLEERNSLLIEDINFKDKVWKLSYENAVNNNAPTEVLASIKETMERVAQTKKEILDNNNYYITLESKINTQTNYVEDVIDDIKSLKNSEVYDLLYLRHPPIWKTKFDTKLASNFDQEEHAIVGKISNMYKLAQNEKSGIVLFVFYLIITILLFRYFKRGFEKHPFNDTGEIVLTAKNLIINQNVLCITFMSLLFAQLYFTTLPKIVGDVITLLAIMVAVPIIMPLMSKRFKNILYFVVLFYILNSAKSYFWFASLGYRLYILLEAIIVIAILYHYTHPFFKTIKQFKDGFNWLLIRLTPVIYVLSIISILSNIFGYTNLTDITLKISTQSGIITILFYSFTLIINGIAISIIHRHFTVKATYSPLERASIENKTLKVIRWCMYFLWGIFFLAMIDVLRPVTEFLTDVFTEPYKMGSLTFTLGEIFSFIITLLIAFVLTRLISFLINDDDGVLRFLKLPKGIPAAVSLVIRYFIIGFGIVLALSSLGIDLSKFNLMAGALGLGIGFGLQTVVSNFISGIILVFERPILPGDTVEVNNLLGTVNRIGVRSSSISTFDGAEVVVPNNNLISNDLINWTLSNNTKRVEILVGTSYDSDPNRILEILTEVATNHQYTLQDPAPRALFNDFGDSSLNFRLLFWVHYEFGLQSKSDVSIAIYNRFKAEGIEIPFPQRDLNVRNVPEDVFRIPNTPVPLNTPDQNPLDKTMEKPFVQPLKTDVNSDDTSEKPPHDDNAGKT